MPIFIQVQKLQGNADIKSTDVCPWMFPYSVLIVFIACWVIVGFVSMFFSCLFLFLILHLKDVLT